MRTVAVKDRPYALASPKTFRNSFAAVPIGRYLDMDPRTFLWNV